ncbi:hypothetical protein PTKIN_Ptkin12aG0021600 [Pterospermum kingtungense]
MENTSKRITLCSKNLSILLLPCLFLFIEYFVVPLLVTPSDGLSLDNRPWIGVGNGKYSPIKKQNNNNKSSLALKASQQSSLIDTVPYSTARLSYSEFTYSIPLTTGQKFIRLHFCPTSYPGFDEPSTKAFFSVKASRFTLLRNFSALHHARGRETLVKEFCANVDEDQRLNLTFIPSPDISDSYAFINGIEIVSMPTYLYYRPTGDDVPFLGQGRLYPLGNNSAFENHYRVNDDGSQISAAEDTGMFRSWLCDEYYLTIAKPSALPVDTSVNLTFSNIPSFSAPREIYETARTMGTDKTVNENYNLTWEFPVDSGFNYFVRLHFCEFQIEITKPGDRVFEIFLANLTAETQADVIVWSGGNGIPTYMDYVVAIEKKGNQDQQNLSIALHPYVERRTLYSDAILNGLEIFKLSNSFDLSTPNPDPISNLFPRKPPKGKSGKNTKIIVGVVGPISCFVAISLLIFLIFHIRSNKYADNSSQALASYICRHFSLREIKAATNNFDKNFIIGRGGFGNVYRGFINAASTPVAIKRLSPGSKQGLLEFRTEIETLSRLRHHNLVSLIGYCKDNNEMILVYDYMVHGTLRDHLYNTDKPPLSWEQRLRICIGAAHGINYLHTGPNHTIIHRDVKTTNILLDEKWVAKVSDFGLSKMNDMSNTHISTVVKGSFGYLDPEYYRFQRLTEKSDVYSFGVVLCEVLCARAPIDRSGDHMQISLAEWVQHCYNNGTLDQIIDPHLQGMISPPSLLKFGAVAISCLASEGNKRPAMSEVVCGLELAWLLQESEVNGSRENYVNDSTVIDNHMLFTSGSGSMNVGR